MPYLTKEAIEWALSELRGLNLSKNDADFATQLLYYRRNGMTVKNALRTGDQSNQALTSWYEFFGTFGPEDCEIFPEQEGISHFNPFQRDAEKSLQPKMSVKSFLGSRLTENVITWKSSKKAILKITDLDVRPRAALVRCARGWEDAFLRANLKDKTLNITAITFWINRFKEFPNEDIDSQVKILLQQMNLVDSKIFNQKNPDSDIELFSEDTVSSQEVRDLFDWTEEEGERVAKLTDEQEPGIEPYLGDYSKMKSFAETMKTNPELSKEDFLQLLKQSKQIILYGPPGTSKTYLKDLFLTDDENYKVRTIQFHQNYTYEQFISGYIFEDGKPTFQNGVLWKIVDECNDDEDQDFVLFIDEINRGNVSKILGECFNALDRGNKVECLYSKGDGSPVLRNLELPSNLYLIGTMNTVDLSLTKIDAALRRRFAFVPKYPELAVLESLTDDTAIREGIITQYMSYINSQIAKVFGSDGPLIGHAIFLPSGFKDDGKYVWETKQELRLFHNYTIYPLVQAECESANVNIGEILGNLGQIYADDEEFFAAISSTLYGEGDE